ncbi:MAG: hypothetical protein P8X90_00275 [Desulfobacterales bacterium]
MKHSKFVWERFATAIKIDGIPLFDVSGHGVIGRFRPRRDSMFHASA